MGDPEALVLGLDAQSARPPTANPERVSQRTARMPQSRAKIYRHLDSRRGGSGVPVLRTRDLGRSRRTSVGHAGPRSRVPRSRVPWSREPRSRGVEWKRGAPPWVHRPNPEPRRGSTQQPRVSAKRATLGRRNHQPQTLKGFHNGPPACRNL